MLLAGTALGCSAAGIDAVATDAAATGGSGSFTTCRSWIVVSSCSTYHKVSLPEHIAVGDRIKLTYGSNMKEYIFHVVGIRPHGESCTVMSPETGPEGDGEKLEVESCHPEPKAAGAR